METLNIQHRTLNTVVNTKSVFNPHRHFRVRLSL